MKKFNKILKYFIIAALFAITISTVTTVKINAADITDPYQVHTIKPIYK